MTPLLQGNLPGLVPVSIELLRRNALPSWRELVWAYEMGILGWHNLTDVAEAQLESGKDCLVTAELAGVGKGDAWRAIEIANSLAAREPPVDQQGCKSKWLYLLLKSLHEQRANFLDPLQIVEQLFADFEYPEEMYGFVRWMPGRDGISETEGLITIEEEWTAYLDRGGSR